MKCIVFTFCYNPFACNMITHNATVDTAFPLTPLLLFCVSYFRFGFVSTATQEREKTPLPFATHSRNTNHASKFITEVRIVFHSLNPGSKIDRKLQRHRMVVMATEQQTTNKNAKLMFGLITQIYSVILSIRESRSIARVHRQPRYTPYKQINKSIT